MADSQGEAYEIYVSIAQNIAVAINNLAITLVTVSS